MINNVSLKRAKILSIVTILLLSSIGIKLGYSCLFLHNNLTSLADEEHERSFPLMAKRGIIYDSNGISLTYNESTLSMYAIPNQIKDKEYVASRLNSIFKINDDYFYNLINKKTSIVNFSKYGRHIDKLTAKQINNEKLDGLYLVDDNKRTYPY